MLVLSNVSKKDESTYTRKNTNQGKMLEKKTNKQHEIKHNNRSPQQIFEEEILAALFVFYNLLYVHSLFPSIPSFEL